LVVLKGAIGLLAVGILVLALRPVALFVGEERWVDVDGTDFAKRDATSYLVNEGLRGVVGHWAYPTLMDVTVPAGQSDAAVRGVLAVSRDVLPAVLRMNGKERELLFYTSDPSTAAERARAAGFRFGLSQEPGWKVYRQYAQVP
jgi:hypothetical protein